MALKEGYMSYFKDGVFKDEWVPRYFRFYDDGVIEMYKDKQDKSVDQKVNLRDVCEFICVGHFTKNVPGKPKLPKTSNPALVIAYPQDQERDEDEVVWLMCNTMDELNDWMKTFISTFPGGKRSASAAKRYEDALKRDRMEYERKYNRPVDDAEANAAAFMNQSGGGYDPIKNANMVQAEESSIEGWRFNNSLPRGVGFGYGAAWARKPGYSQVFEAPPPSVNIFINNGGNNIINTGDDNRQYNNDEN